MGVVVQIGDARAIGFCSRGVRAFFKAHGLDYLKFVRNGLPEEDLRAFNDGMVDRVIEQAHERLKGDK